MCSPCIVFTCISVWDKLAEPWGTHSKEKLVIPLAVLKTNITKKNNNISCVPLICLKTKGGTTFSSFVHRPISQVTSQPLNETRKALNI